MSKYIIEIDTSNAAFEDKPEYEISRILRVLAAKVENGHRFDFNLRDTNGNKVGFAFLEEVDEESEEDEEGEDEDGEVADAAYYDWSCNKGANDD